MEETKLSFPEEQERKIAVMRVLRRQKNKLPCWIDIYAGKLSKAILSNPDISNPDELIHLAEMRSNINN